MKKLTTLSFKSFTKFNKVYLAFTILFNLGITSLMAQSPYCDPVYSSQGGNCTTYSMSINALEIKQGSNTLYTRSHTTSNGGCNASSGQYFLMSSSSMFTLKAGGTYSFGFTTGPTYSVNIMIWIDLNADNDFADAGEFLSNPACVYSVGNSGRIFKFNLLQC